MTSPGILRSDIAVNEKLTLKEQIGRLVAEVENARKGNAAGSAALQAELDALRAANGGLKAALAKLEADRKAALEANASQAGGAAARLAAAEDRARRLEVELEAALAEALQLRENGRVEQSRARETIASLEAELNAAKSTDAVRELGRLKERLKKLEPQVSMMKEVIDRAYAELGFEGAPEGAPEGASGGASGGASPRGSPLGHRSGGGSGAGGYQHLRIQRLVDLVKEMQSKAKQSVQEMHEELEKATKMLQKLRASLIAQAQGDGPRVQEVREQAKRDRAVLVSAALSSLSQLRSHLIFALTGLRESSASLPSSMRAQSTSFVEHPALSGYTQQAVAASKLAWATRPGAAGVSIAGLPQTLQQPPHQQQHRHPMAMRFSSSSPPIDGRLESLVLRLEVPPMNSLGITGLHPVPPAYIPHPASGRSAAGAPPRPRTMAGGHSSTPREHAMAVQGSSPRVVAAPMPVPNQFNTAATSPVSSDAIRAWTAQTARPMTPGNPAIELNLGPRLPNALPLVGRPSREHAREVPADALYSPRASGRAASDAMDRNQEMIAELHAVVRGSYR